MSFHWEERGRHVPSVAGSNCLILCRVAHQAKALLSEADLMLTS